jgi:hypothetical protein
MQVGDTAIVKVTGRHVRIVGELSQDRYDVEFLPDPSGDPLDRDTVQSEDQVGIYRGEDLEPVE